MKNKKRKITIEEVREFVRERLDVDKLGTRGLRFIVKEILPFSFEVYCKENKLNTRFLMDEHEKRINKEDRIKKNESYACGECGFYTKDINQMNEHMKEHKKETSNICKNCGKTQKKHEQGVWCKDGEYVTTIIFQPIKTKLSEGENGD